MDYKVIQQLIRRLRINSSHEIHSTTCDSKSTSIGNQGVKSPDNILHNLEEQMTQLLTKINRVEHYLLRLTRIDTLSELIHRVYAAFEGRSSVDVAHVKFLMESYVSNADDWKRYAQFDENRYTRNLVDEGDGKFNLILLCWSQGQASSIHDHAQAHCFMKMLQGLLMQISAGFENPKVL
ncbi:hypothetical protein M8J77_018497 [Diaphorina citri]|nr:hypothetical protein M8J77_018497 [Diaphorina citri]